MICGIRIFSLFFIGIPSENKSLNSMVWWAGVCPKTFYFVLCTWSVILAVKLNSDKSDEET